MGGLFRACRSIKKLSDGSGDDRQEGLCSGGRSGDDRQEGRRSGGRTIVLAGDPNVGKSVFFTALSGVYREVSNYAGTTVDVRCARLGQDTLVDIPGVYGVGSASEEERVARDVVLSADIVINIVDAVHLSRDLFLTIQLIEMGIPLIVVLNMMDEADRRGIIIDRETLSHRLGVPVVGASG
ncbi:MAG: 50S ribosome-binding GTPase, partial [Selenomonadales bacterium]|nr:50S ribosome-binding GTPase [Selenomonadales bacterium]